MKPPALRIGWSTTALMGVETDREVANAVRASRAAVGRGHHVSEESPEFDGVTAMRSMTDVWFFGFDLRLEGYAKRTGRRLARTRSNRSCSRFTSTRSG
jgi:hypothetical protein